MTTLTVELVVSMESNLKFDFSQIRLFDWLDGFYGISTLVGYLMPNLVYTYI